MTSTTTVRKTIGRDLPNGDYIEIHAEERDGSTGLSAGFAITCSGWERRGTRSGRSRSRNAVGMARDMDYGGADHDTILKAAPELAPLVKVHLAGPDGTPMHAVANGWYFYRGAHVAYELVHYGQAYVDRHGTAHERAARCLHIEPGELPFGMDEVGFRNFASDLSPVWAKQATEARAVLEAMFDQDGVA